MAADQPLLSIICKHIDRPLNRSFMISVVPNLLLCYLIPLCGLKMFEVLQFDETDWRDPKTGQMFGHQLQSSIPRLGYLAQGEAVEGQLAWETQEMSKISRPVSEVETRCRFL